MPCCNGGQPQRSRRLLGFAAQFSGMHDADQIRSRLRYCANGRSPLNCQPVSYRVNERNIGFASHVISRWFAIG